MTPEQIGINLGILLSVLTIIGYLMKFSSDQGQIKFQLTQLWMVVFGNAKVELVTRGLAKAESPLYMASVGYDVIAPFLPRYLPIYRAVLDQSPPDPAEIERRAFQAFLMKAGDQILHDICLPRGLTLGAGIMAVIQACQETTSQPVSEVSHG